MERTQNKRKTTYRAGEVANVEDEQIIEAQPAQFVSEGEFNLDSLNTSSRNSVNDLVKKDIFPEGTMLEIVGAESHEAKPDKNTRYRPYQRVNDTGDFTKLTVKVKGNVYDKHKNEKEQIISKPFEISKGDVGSVVLSDKCFDIWAPKQLHNSSKHYKPTVERPLWFEGLLMIVKPSNDRLQTYMNNKWVAFYYVYEEDLKSKAKDSKMEVTEWVKWYCDDVEKRNGIEYVK